MREDIEKQLTEKATKHKIPCAEARRIAEALGVEYKEVGAVADALGIKIRDCDLGCF